MILCSPLSTPPDNQPEYFGVYPFYEKIIGILISEDAMAMPIPTEQGKEKNP